jgi:hypothetical protein
MIFPVMCVFFLANLFSCVSIAVDSIERELHAPACFLEEEYLQEKNIEFVGIPYNLFKRNNS